MGQMPFNPVMASFNIWACCMYDDDADAKIILTAPQPDNWKRPPGCPRIM